MSDELKESKSAVQPSAFSVQPCLYERGVTLVELMFGLTISLAAIAAGYTVMSTSQKAASVNSQTAEMQQNVRVAMELLTQDLRTAGFGMAGTVGNCATAIVPADNTTGGADTGPDAVSLVVPTPLSTLSVQVNGGPTVTTVTLQPGAVAAMSPEGFGVNAVISVNGVLARNVTAVATDTLSFGTAIGAPAVFPVGTPVFWLRCIRYDIVRATDANAAILCGGNPPCLRRGPNPDTNPTSMVAVAEGIEDLQLAYACDGCNGAVPDGIIDDQNASNTFDTADFISNNAWTASPTTSDKIRMVRLSIVARQTQNDSQWSSTAPIVAEDHDPTKDAGFVMATYQQSRRRLLTRTVQVRNLGF